MSKLDVVNVAGGPAVVTHEDGSKVAICRCGKSSNGVTCDGSHATKK